MRVLLRLPDKSLKLRRDFLVDLMSLKYHLMIKQAGRSATETTGKPVKFLSDGREK